MTMSKTTHIGRILGTPVPMLMPLDGPVYVLLVGEAPGPRGADKSGVPFLGDAAGKVLYDVLVRLGAMTLPPEIECMAWDGSLFVASGIVPVAQGVALGNAFDRCPTDDGATFRAPMRSELEGTANLARLTRDINILSGRGLKGIVTLGRVATRTIEVLFKRAPMPELARRALPHPSAQGLLSMAPDRGKGAKMADLQEAWMVRCQYAILQAGFPAPEPDKS
ncbi:uracil-DNA glycosylase family protein [Gemmatimonas sp.]|uniref:uracil-DNA glycosylase family protein n=1 Tax=Gemmatimonas sp. TaxID=1962908 RepID=UPI0039830882